MSRAILFASFGTADEEVKKSCLDSLMEDLKFSFPDDKIISVYTSEILRKKAEEKGMLVPGLSDTLDMLASKHYDTVFIQPSHITPGEEYQRKLQEIVAAYEEKFAVIRLGEPLLSQPGDYQKLLYAILQDLHVPSGHQLVLVGHGSPHQHNEAYEKLQAHIDREGLPIHIGVIEKTDTPNFDDVLARLRKDGENQVVLAPLLLMNGMHVMRDIAGDGEDSWKSRLEREGFLVRTFSHGLGEYPGVRRIIADKLLRLTGKA